MTDLVKGFLHVGHLQGRAPSFTDMGRSGRRRLLAEVTVLRRGATDGIGADEYVHAVAWPAWSPTPNPRWPTPTGRMPDGTV